MATVTGTILDANSEAVSSASIEFRPKSTPIIQPPSVVIASGIVRVDTEIDGTFSIVLEQGDYQVTIKRVPHVPNNTFQITVPNDSATYTIDLLITSAATAFESMPDAVAELQGQIEDLTALLVYRGYYASDTVSWFKEIVTSEAYELTAINYDSDGVVTTATVLWPDGSAGVYTVVTKNATFLLVDAFTITHTNSSKTITQALVTRNAQGLVTSKPALTIA